VKTHFIYILIGDAKHHRRKGIIDATHLRESSQMAGPQYRNPSKTLPLKKDIPFHFHAASPPTGRIALFSSPSLKIPLITNSTAYNRRIIQTKNDFAGFNREIFFGAVFAPRADNKKEQSLIWEAK
jgi:hypothetical protein